MNLALFLPETSVDSWTMLKAIWNPHIWILTSSMFLTLILTPVFRAIAMKYRVYDMPDDRLKTHRRPIPYLGGLAIFFGFAIPVLVIAGIHSWHPSPLPSETQRVIAESDAVQADDEIASPATVVEDVDRPWIEKPERMFWVVAAAGMAMLLGLIDDLKNLPPKLKIIGQVVTALILVGGGIRFMAFPAIKLDGSMLFPPEAWWVVGIGLVIQIMLVVGAANATNLLDGLDGLCSGVMGFISTGFMLLATSLLAWDLFHAGGVHYVNAQIVMILSFAMLGAVLGFLPYNFNPATIFMGDAGSMFLGFMAAAFMLLFAESSGSFKWFLGSMVIFGLPIFDTGLALVRRLAARKPIFAGDRSHFYDQLVDRGFTVKQTVLVNYLLAACFAAIGVGIVFLKVRMALPVYIIIFALIAAAAMKLGLVRPRGAKRRGGKGGAS